MDWTESVREDLMAMRRLAEQGGRLTMPGGPYYVLWGIITGTGFLFTYLVGTRILALPGWTIGACWGVLVVIGWLISAWRGTVERRNPDSLRMTNRIVSSVWVMTGAAMGVFFFANLASGFLPGSVMGVFSCFFAGVAFGVIALLCRLNWMLVPTAGWFALGVSGMFLHFDAVTIPFFFGAFVLLMVGTGLKLIAMERQAHG